MGLGKCWPDLEISTAFVTGLKVLFSCDFMFQGLKFILRLVKLIKCLKLQNWGLKVLQSIEFTIRYPLSGEKGDVKYNGKILNPGKVNLFLVF